MPASCDGWGRLTADDVHKIGRIQNGNALLKKLHTPEINSEALADTIVVYFGIVQL